MKDGEEVSRGWGGSEWRMGGGGGGNILKIIKTIFFKLKTKKSTKKSENLKKNKIRNLKIKTK